MPLASCASAGEPIVAHLRRAGRGEDLRLAMTDEPSLVVDRLCVRGFDLERACPVPEADVLVRSLAILDVRVQLQAAERAERHIDPRLKQVPITRIELARRTGVPTRGAQPEE